MLTNSSAIKSVGTGTKSPTRSQCTAVRIAIQGIHEPANLLVSTECHLTVIATFPDSLQGFLKPSSLDFVQYCGRCLHNPISWSGTPSRLPRCRTRRLRFWESVLGVDN